MLSIISATIVRMQSAIIKIRQLKKTFFNNLSDILAFEFWHGCLSQGFPFLVGKNLVTSLKIQSSNAQRCPQGHLHHFESGDGPGEKVAVVHRKFETYDVRSYIWIQVATSSPGLSSFKVGILRTEITLETRLFKFSLQHGLPLFLIRFIFWWSRTFQSD